MPLLESLKPSGQTHWTEPTRLRQSPGGGQKSAVSAHSSTSRHVVSSSANVKPSAHSQSNAPAVFRQRPFRHTPSLERHSSMSEPETRGRVSRHRRPEAGSTTTDDQRPGQPTQTTRDRGNHHRRPEAGSTDTDDQRPGQPPQTTRDWVNHHRRPEAGSTDTDDQRLGQSPQTTRGRVNHHRRPEAGSTTTDDQRLGQPPQTTRDWVNHHRRPDRVKGCRNMSTDPECFYI